MSKVELKNVTKIFGKTVAVKNVSFIAEDGEFVVIVGPSGCGKSTILRLIAGLEKPTEGEIYIDGKIVNDVPPKERDIAMVFQDYALYPHMTVYENLAFPLRLRKYPKDEIDKKVKEVAKLLQLENLLSRRPGQLSGGQRQRVALGRAIIRNPKAFLFDEPLSNLDAKLRNQMRTELLRLHKKLGVTSIYVTHDQIEAMTMGTKIVVLNAGVIQQIADPLTLYEKPQNKFVAGFIGTPTMNFIEGKGEKDEFISKDFKIKLKKVPRGEIILGVRPEDILLCDEKEAHLKAQVEIIEPIGNENFLHLKIGDTNLTARAPYDVKIKAGEIIPVKFNENRLHFFDKKTEKRIEISKS